MKLSVLIPTTRRRKPYLERLLNQIKHQIGDYNALTSNRIGLYIFSDIEVIIDRCESCKIGAKRNYLLELATGEYTCFIDDDDRISDNYFALILEAIKTNPDCVSLRGIMTVDGANPQMFEHSIRYRAYATTTNPIKYERYPNHLNTIRADISKRFKFVHKNWGEDTDWATEIFRAGAIKTEAYIDDILYYYDYISNK